MIRVIVDELGDGHSDIILKIDAMPVFAHIGDLYYMVEFLCLESDTFHKTPSNLGVEYVGYVQDKFNNLDKEETFIAFDISDQYVGGLLASKGKKGLIQVCYGWTDRIHGYEVNKESIDRLLKEQMPDFHLHGEWLLPMNSIVAGLDWSLERVKKTSRVSLS
ncbi:MAG: hypothetical protein AB7H80_14650 [Candidatus Kapaibacterium sp.]